MAQPLAGWLSKQGPQKKLQMSKWKKRWFCQSDFVLSYYTSEAKTDCKGTIDMKQALAVKPIAKKKLQFQIVLPKRIFILLASSEEDLTYWMNGLEKLMKKSQTLCLDLEKKEKHFSTMVPMRKRSSMPDLWIEQHNQALQTSQKLGQSLKTLPAEDTVVVGQVGGDSAASSAVAASSAAAASIAANKKKALRSKIKSEYLGKGQGQADRIGASSVRKPAPPAFQKALSAGELGASDGASAETTLSASGASRGPRHNDRKSLKLRNVKALSPPPSRPHRDVRSIPGFNTAPAESGNSNVQTGIRELPSPPLSPTTKPLSPVTTPGRVTPNRTSPAGTPVLSPSSSPRLLHVTQISTLARPKAPLRPAKKVVHHTFHRVAAPEGNSSDEMAGGIVAESGHHFGTLPRNLDRPGSEPCSPKHHATARYVGGLEEVLLSANDNRTRLLKEIITTERFYIEHMNVMVKNYMHPLVVLTKTEASIGYAEISRVFSNITTIVPVNEELLRSLEERMEETADASQLIIGDIFMKLVPFLKMYNEYGNNYNSALEALRDLNQNSKFVAVLEVLGTAHDLNLKSLDAFLIMPVQRIPRYRMLLSELKKYTPADHPDYGNLSIALERMDSVADFLNKNIKDSENLKKFAELSPESGLIAPHRSMLYSGVLFEEGKRCKMQVYLCNDVLVRVPVSDMKSKPDMTTPRYMWPLKLVWPADLSDKGVKRLSANRVLVEIGQGKANTLFEVLGPRKAHVFRASNEKEKNMWMDELRKAVAAACGASGCGEQDLREAAYDFPNGGSYSGSWLVGEMHGQGTFKYFGNEYTGEWVSSKRHGKGSMKFASGDSYNGDWKNDKMDGKGRFQYSAGDVYDGEWSEGKRSGQGVFSYVYGDKYSGGWLNNQPCGYGKLMMCNGSYVYDGYWLDGRYHEKGVLTSKLGVYEGSWCQGQRHGQGKMVYADGCCYTGQWESDMRHGQGKFQSKIVGDYEGEWKSDTKEGRGVMWFANGDRYEGQWKRDTFHGTGVIVCAGGMIKKYEGEFKNGMKDGKGVAVFQNGDRYEGGFKDDLMHGTGQYTAVNCARYEGKWSKGEREGKFLYVAPAGVGAMKMHGEVRDDLVTNKEKRVPTVHLPPQYPVFSMRR